MSQNTNELVTNIGQAVISLILKGELSSIDKLDLSYLLNFWKTNKDTILDHAFSEGDKKEGDISDNLSLSILIYAFSRMQNGLGSWDKEHVRSKYLIKAEGLELIYYPARNPKKMLVTFSSMGRDSFDRYSRYFDRTEQWNSDTAFLFFKDPDNNYYLGSDLHPMTGRHIRFIKTFMEINGLGASDVFTTGSSMGGYAALYYAIEMQLKGALVYAPQVNRRGLNAHEFRNWEKHVAKCGSQWVELDQMVHRKGGLPCIYIEYGHYAADKIAAEDFLENFKYRRDYMLIERKLDVLDHTLPDCLQSNDVLNAIDLFHRF